MRFSAIPGSQVVRLAEIIKELGWVAEHAGSASSRLGLMTAKRGE